MDFQASFSPEEWRTLQFAFLWVFHAVSGADGRVDPKEIDTICREIDRASAPEAPLAHEVLQTMERDFVRLYIQYRHDPRHPLKGLEGVADLLDRKTPADLAAGFKAALVRMGRGVAASSVCHESSPRGGASREENRAVARVREALRAEG